MDNSSDNIKQLREELARTRSELHILYEITNAMRTSLKLDEILFAILTGVTAHVGLGFNRAMLFLINQPESMLEGKMAIGADTGEEANRIWKRIDQESMDLDDLMLAYKLSGQMIDSKVNQAIKTIKIPLNESGGVLAATALNGMVLHIGEDTIRNIKDDTFIKSFKSQEFVSLPLKAKNKVLGVLVVDNIFTQKAIRNEDIRILMMFANQAGLAIENSILFEQTIVQAQTDSLTGLWNHGFFQSSLEREVNEANRLSDFLSLLLIDIDNFKVYNDTLGHQAGDKLLLEISKIIKNASRKLDYVCRYGGEEFAVILPHTPNEEAITIAERIREQVEKYRFYRQEVQPSQVLTISIGISSLPLHSEEKAQLLNLADKALYKAKQQGKNRVCVY